MMGVRTVTNAAIIPNIGGRMGITVSNCCQIWSLSIGSDVREKIAKLRHPIAITYKMTKYVNV